MTESRSFEDVYKAQTERIAQLEHELAALRERLAQKEQGHEYWCASLTQLLLINPPKPAPCNCKTKLTEPQPRREWVGLTEEEMAALKQKRVTDGMTRLVSDFEYIQSIEAKLKEKNT